MRQVKSLLLLVRNPLQSELAQSGKNEKQLLSDPVGKNRHWIFKNQRPSNHSTNAHHTARPRLTTTVDTITSGTVSFSNMSRVWSACARVIRPAWTCLSKPLACCSRTCCRMAGCEK